jgi:hypothetical protein
MIMMTRMLRLRVHILQFCVHNIDHSVPHTNAPAQTRGQMLYHLPGGLPEALGETRVPGEKERRAAAIMAAQQQALSSGTTGATSSQPHHGSTSHPTTPKTNADTPWSPPVATKPAVSLQAKQPFSPPKCHSSNKDNQGRPREGHMLGKEVCTRVDRRPRTRGGTLIQFGKGKGKGQFTRGRREVTIVTLTRGGVRATIPSIETKIGVHRIDMSRVRRGGDIRSRRPGGDLGAGFLGTNSSDNTPSG